MILSTKARYAVMAMVELAARGSAGRVALSELAEAQEIPKPYLEQLFAKLRKAGLVAATRGPGGGYGLARDASAINVAEIVAAVEESLKMTRCGEEAAGCMTSHSRCATHDLWEGLGQHIEGYLRNVPLSQLADKLTAPPSCGVATDFIGEAKI